MTPRAHYIRQTWVGPPPGPGLSAKHSHAAPSSQPFPHSGLEKRPRPLPPAPGQPWEVTPLNRSPAGLPQAPAQRPWALVVPGTYWALGEQLLRRKRGKRKKQGQEPADFLLFCPQPEWGLEPWPASLDGTWGRLQAGSYLEGAHPKPDTPRSLRHFLALPCWPGPAQCWGALGETRSALSGCGSSRPNLSCPHPSPGFLKGPGQWSPQMAHALCPRTPNADPCTRRKVLGCDPLCNCTRTTRAPTPGNSRAPA